MLNSSKKGKENQERQARQSEKLLPSYYSYVENVQMLERFVWHCMLYNIFFYYSEYFKRIPCKIKKVGMVELEVFVEILKVMTLEL